MSSTISSRLFSKLLCALPAVFTPLARVPSTYWCDVLDAYAKRRGLRVVKDIEYSTCDNSFLLSVSIGNVDCSDSISRKDLIESGRTLDDVAVEKFDSMAETIVNNAGPYI